MIWGAEGGPGGDGKDPGEIERGFGVVEGSLAVMRAILGGDRDRNWAVEETPGGDRSDFGGIGKGSGVLEMVPGVTAVILRG